METQLNQAAPFQRMNHGTLGDTAPDAPRVDLSYVRSRLEDCVNRAHGLGAGAHVLADAILGSRPETANGSGAPQSIQPSLSDLVDDLARALNRIETALSRL